MRLSRGLWITLAAVFTLHGAGASANAQTDAPRPPLFDLLALTPDNENARATWSYVDYHALITSREGAVLPQSYQEWLAGNDAEDAATGAVNAALFGVSTGPGELIQFMATEDYAATIGIDFFEIERAVSYGMAPTQVTALQGDFDPDAIDAAYTARGYEVLAASGITTYCGENGCDGGAVQNLTRRDTADPFGGNLGRQQPVLLFEGSETNASRDLVASAVPLSELAALEGVYTGDSPSLLDAPEYRAAAEAVTRTGTLRQAWFNRADELDLANQLPFDLSDDATRFREELMQSLTPIPEAQLFVFADTATETGQTAYVALVYADATDAQSATDIAVERLASLDSNASRRAWADILDDRSITVSSSVYESAETGLAVALIALETPPLVPFVEGEMPEFSASAFRLLVNAYSRRDLLWLAMGSGE